MRLNDEPKSDISAADNSAGASRPSEPELPPPSHDVEQTALTLDVDEPLDSDEPTDGQDEPTDGQLVERVRNGDQSACELIVRRYGPRMLSTARRLLNVDADALDAVQDAFLSAFRTIDSFEGRSQLGSWLYRIVVNASLMKLRTKRRRKERSIDDLLPKYNDGGTLSDHVQSWRLTHDKAVEMRETRKLVRDSIAELPEPYRAVLLLRDIEELNTEEAAEALEISPAAVRTRLHRARQALKSLLDEHMTEIPA